MFFLLLAGCSKSNVPAVNKAEGGAVDAAVEPLQTDSALGDFPCAFAVADHSGSRLLINYYDDAGFIEEVAEPEQYALAYGAYGECVHIVYDGFQESTDPYSSDFDDSAGYVYHALNGRLRPDKYYVLTTESLLPDALIRLYPPHPDSSDPYHNLTRLRTGLQFEDFVFLARGQRKVKWAEQLAITEEGGMIALVVYERAEGSSRSDYSIVYQCGPETLFWDDDGYFDISPWWPDLSAMQMDAEKKPSVYEPLFLARLDNKLVMALNYIPPGVETGELVILYEDSGRFAIKGK